MTIKFSGKITVVFIICNYMYIDNYQKLCS